MITARILVHSTSQTLTAIDVPDNGGALLVDTLFSALNGLSVEAQGGMGAIALHVVCCIGAKLQIGELAHPGAPCKGPAPQLIYTIGPGNQGLTQVTVTAPMGEDTPITLYQGNPDPTFREVMHKAVKTLPDPAPRPVVSAEFRDKAFDILDFVLDDPRFQELVADVKDRF